jgi:Leucine-rich repeat (LRR) protein
VKSELTALPKAKRARTAPAPALPQIASPIPAPTQTQTQTQTQPQTQIPTAPGALSFPTRQLESLSLAGVRATGLSIKERLPVQSFVDLQKSGMRVERLRFVCNSAFEPGYFCALFAACKFAFLTSLTINSTDFCDLEGIAAFVPRLHSLSIGTCKIQNVWAIAKLKHLAKLVLVSPDIEDADLKYVAECPLTSLSLCNTTLTSLQPLAHLPLTSLNLCVSQSIANSELAHLARMPLTYLGLCRIARINDLSHLRRLPLRTLVISGTSVRDLSPLRGMSLTVLDIGNTPVHDLSPLGGMPLVRLTANATGVHDLRPLALAPASLVHLDLSRTQITNASLESLAGLPLRTLCIRKTMVSDLRPLAGMRLTMLEVSHTDVGSEALKTLRGMPLRRLDIVHTKINTLSHFDSLVGMPLTHLFVTSASIAALAKDEPEVLCRLLQVPSLAFLRVAPPSLPLSLSLPPPHPQFQPM